MSIGKNLFFKKLLKNVILLFCFILIFFFYNKFVKIKKKFNLFV